MGVQGALYLLVPPRQADVGVIYLFTLRGLSKASFGFRWRASVTTFLVFLLYLLAKGEGDLAVATSTPGGDAPPKQSSRAAENRRGKVGPTTAHFQAHHVWSRTWALA